MEGYQPRAQAELAAVKAAAGASFEGICTGCAYCDDCPQEIPIPQFMDAYNQKLLGAGASGVDLVGDRLKWHWQLERSRAASCVACGQCEGACTQHINIIERLKEIAG
jgi:predicted aldo/keto reductase-like oxidoreductase